MTQAKPEAAGQARFADILEAAERMADAIETFEGAVSEDELIKAAAAFRKAMRGEL